MSPAAGITEGRRTEFVEKTSARTVGSVADLADDHRHAPVE